MQNNNLEQEVVSIILGILTQDQVLERRNMDSRSYNELVDITISKTNPKMYLQWITKVKGISSKGEYIDFVSLIMEVMQTRKSKATVFKQLGLSKKLVARRILSYSDSNNIDAESGLLLKDIYELDKAYVEGTLSTEQQKKIDSFKPRPIILTSIIQNTENRIKEVIVRYENLVAGGIDKDEAARQVGYSNHNSIETLRRELKGLEEEETFREGLKCEIKNTYVQQNNRGNTGKEAWTLGEL